MNPGVSEEVGQTARGIVAALASQPLLLSLVLLNLAMIAFMFYYITQTFKARTSNLEQLYSSQQVIFGQWSDILKHQATLIEKLEHCVAIDDFAKLAETINTRGTKP